jgi:hypothetical protein
MKKAQRGGSEGCRSITEMVPLILDDLSEVIYKIHHCPARVATRKGGNSEKFTLCRLKSSFFIRFRLKQEIQIRKRPFRVGCCGKPLGLELW